MKTMGVDYGDRRTGIAISDISGSIVGDAWTIDEWNAERLADEIVRIATEREVGQIVIGLPKNMDGTEGERAGKCREFAELVKSRCAVPVAMWDERRSSVEAHAILHANGKKEKKHRKTVDAVAASLILEGYLAANG